MLDQTRMKQRHYFYDFALDGNEIYFSTGFYNALCRASLSNDQVEILKSFPDLPENRGLAYYGIYRLGEYLLLCPFNDSDDFLLYDMKADTFRKLTNQGQIGFYSSAVWEKDNMLYIVSTRTTEIYKVNLQNFSVKMLSCKKYVTDNACINEIVRLENLLYIPLNQKGIMLIFDIEKEEFTYFRYPQNVSFVATLCYYDGKFWTTGKDRKILKWQANESVASEVAKFPDDVTLLAKDGSWFGRSYIYNNILWLIPNCSDSILKYNFLTEQFEKIDIAGEEESVEQLEEEMKHGRYMRSKYNAIKKYENKVFFLSPKTRIFYEMNLETGNVCRHDFCVNNIYNGRIYPSPANGVALEQSYANGLECLISYIEKEKANQKEINDEVIGKTIHCNINESR